MIVYDNTYILHFMVMERIDLRQKYASRESDNHRERPKYEVWGGYD